MLYYYDKDDVVWMVKRKDGNVLEDVYVICDTKETADIICDDWNQEVEISGNRWGFPGYEVESLSLAKIKPNPLKVA